jgi:hypothetical protein
MPTYEIGHGKPPKETQFKKGTSGNPKGRPKGSKNIRTILQEQLLKPVTVTQNGRQTRMALIAVVGARLVNKAAKGDDKAMKLALDYAIKLDGLETRSTAALTSDQSPFDLSAEEMASISKSKLLKGVT